MENIFNRKTRLMLTVAVCILIIAVSFSSAIAKSVNDNDNIKGEQVPVVSSTKPVGPILSLFYRIFNDDWNYWNNKPHMFAISTGNIGIGTTNPTEKLDVSGTVQMTGFKMPTGGSNGHVLTSDSTGVGSWQLLPSGEGIGGNGEINYLPKFIGATTVGNSLIYELNNNIGIGTETPNSRLEVDGKIHSTQGGFKFPDETTQTSAASGDGHSLDASDGSPSDVVYVDSEGNVGIGTTIPQEKLHVNGTVNATFFIGDGSGIMNVPVGGRPQVVYTGDGFDSYMNYQGTDEQSEELGPIPSNITSGMTYLRIEITGTCVSHSFNENNGMVQLKIQTKEIGGSYSDSLGYTTVKKTHVLSNTYNMETATFTFVWYHTLTNLEKTNGVQIQVFSKSICESQDNYASFTNLQTVITPV